jgi:hypothetical protein
MRGVVLKHSLYTRMVRSPTAWLLLLAVMVISACGTSQGAAPTVIPTFKPSPTATRAVPSQPVNFLSEKGVMLQGVLYGHGTQGIILSNEGNNQSDPWLPVAQQLAQEGYLVLTYMYRDQHTTSNQLAVHALADLRAAIAFLRVRDVTKLVLIGASLGALVTVKEATVKQFDALVVISTPIGYQDVQLSDNELRAVTVPKLFVTSELNDPFTRDTLHMFDVSPGPKEKLVYPGMKHGISLFEGDTGAALVPSLLQFLQRYVPVS